MSVFVVLVADLTSLNPTSTLCQVPFWSRYFFGSIEDIRRFMHERDNYLRFLRDILRTSCSKDFSLVYLLIRGRVSGVVSKGGVSH